MRVQQADTIIQSSTGTLVGEASTLGLRGFPPVLFAAWANKDRVWDLFSFDRQEGEITGARYHERNGPLELLIIND
jgi:hypothetical protein